MCFARARFAGKKAVEKIQISRIVFYLGYQMFSKCDVRGRRAKRLMCKEE